MLWLSVFNGEMNISGCYMYALYMDIIGCCLNALYMNISGCCLNALYMDIGGCYMLVVVHPLINMELSPRLILCYYNNTCQLPFEQIGQIYTL